MKTNEISQKESGVQKETYICKPRGHQDQAETIAIEVQIPADAMNNVQTSLDFMQMA